MSDSGCNLRLAPDQLPRLNKLHHGMSKEWHDLNRVWEIRKSGKGNLLQALVDLSNEASPAGVSAS